MAILKKEISYSNFLVYPKEYVHGFICFIVFISRIRSVFMQSIYPCFPGLVYVKCGDRVIVELAFNMLSIPGGCG